MASSIAEAQPRASVEFAESAILEAVVPADSNVDIEDEFEAWNGAGGNTTESILPFLTQRRELLFDEIVSVYIALRTGLTDDATLKSYLARLAISVEAFALGSAPPEAETKPAAPPKELLLTEIIKDASEPVLVCRSEDSAYAYVFWKAKVYISRPRTRLHKPIVYFQPAATFRPLESVKQGVLDEEYLPSGVPTALNLLQSFENDPALGGVQPRLSALRINKIAPSVPINPQIARPIRTGQRRLFRALPALVWRIRYSRIQAPFSDMSLMASLDLEVPQITGYCVSIQSINLGVKRGYVKDIAGYKASTTVYRPGDQLTFLYKLTPDLSNDGAPILGKEGHMLDLEIKATAMVSEVCGAAVKVSWQNAVDFSLERNSSLVKAAHRLSNPVVPAAKTSDPDDALPEMDSNSQAGPAATDKAIHLTVTVSGPPVVQVGTAFHWEVLIVNRSNVARNLAILALPKRKRDLDKHLTRPSTSSISDRPGDSQPLLGSAVVDEIVVYAKQRNGRADVADLVCLTTDLRISHLAPGACYTAQLKFMPLDAGVLSIDAVRVVDLATHETTDIRDIPGIVAGPKTQ